MYTIYGKPNCPNCTKAKALMKEAYNYVDVTQNVDAFNTLKMLGFKSVPVIYDDMELIGDYNALVRYLTNKDT